jgi:hypothetical protein
MDVYLSQEEIEREKHMFAPRETAYVLEGEVFVVREYKEQTVQGDNAEQAAPLSC